MKVKVWYLAIRDRTTRSNYELDVQFSWDRTGERPTHNRKRIFEVVARLHTMPRHNPSDGPLPKLVKQMNADGEFSGTAQIFSATLWDFLKSPPQDLRAANQWVCQSFKALGLCRLSQKSEEVIYRLRMYEEEFGVLNSSDMYRHRESIRDIEKRYPNRLETLTLFAALYREAYFAGALETALALEKIFLRLTNAYCRQRWVASASKDLREKIFPLALQMAAVGDVSDLYEEPPDIAVQRPIIFIDNRVRETVKKVQLAARKPSRNKELL